MAHSGLPRTAVCLLRVESRAAGGVLITVTTTLDIFAVPQGQSRSVASYDEAVCMVVRFLRQYASGEKLGPEVS